MKIIQKVLAKENENVPIWFMRQAGRYLAEYKEIRKSEKDFLALCYNPQKAAEVTLQPINRFNFDAAIIFSDILVLPNALGWDVNFEENIGPVLKQFTKQEDLNCFDSNHKDEKLSKVYEAINLVRKSLPQEKSLIGFAGAPWTVVSYLLEGKGKQDFSISKKFLYQNFGLAQKLVEFITKETIEHLTKQIEAGCDTVQLFDSWAGMLSEKEYEKFVIKPTKLIVSRIKEKFPEVTFIGFPKGCGFLYEKYIEQTMIDVIGVDQFVPVNIMAKWQKKIVVQGNLDPVVLLTDENTISRKLDNILSKIDKKNFVFNLGHGILQNTPISNVEFAIRYVREFAK